MRARPWRVRLPERLLFRRYAQTVREGTADDRAVKPPPRWRSRAARAMGGSLAAAGTSQILLVMSGVLVARSLGPEDRGYAALLVVVSGVCFLLGSIGLPSAVTYYIARDPGNARRIVTSLGGTGVIQLAVTFALQAVVLLAIVRDDPDRVKLAAAVSMLLVPGLLAFAYGLAILQGQQRFAALNVLRTFPTAAYVIGVLAIFVTGSADLVRVMTVWALASLIGGLLALGVGWRGLPRDSAGDSVPPSRSELAKFGLKGFMGFYSPVDVFRLDQAVVGLFLTPVALGLYVVAQAFTSVPRVISYSIGLVAYPRVASESEPAEARRAMWRYFFFGLAVTTLVVGTLGALTHVLVTVLYGADFDGATPIARILLAGTFFMAVRRVLTDGVNGLGHPVLGTIAEAASWVVLLPAMAVLLPEMGAEGVALALAISWGVSLLLLLVMVLLLGSSATSLTPRAFGSIRSRLTHMTSATRGGTAVATAAVGLSVTGAIAVTALPSHGTTILIVASACALFFVVGRRSVARHHRAMDVALIQEGLYRGAPDAATTRPPIAELGVARSLYFLGVSLIGVLTLRAGGQVTLSDVLFGFSFIFACLELTFRRWAVPIRLPSAFLLGVALFSLGGIISTFEAVEPLKSFAVIVRLIVLTFLWFWLGTLLLNRLEHVVRAMNLWVLTAAICGSAAVVQVLVGDVIPGSTVLYGRATGLTTHPNDLGGLTSIAFVPALVLASRHGIRLRRRALSYLFVLLVAAGLVLSGSVGALLAAVVATFVWLTFQRISLNSVLVISAVGLCVVATMGVQTMRGAPTPLQRFDKVTASGNTSGSGSLGDRISTYRIAVREIKEHPFVGVGLDLVSITRPSGLVSYANDVHNIVIGTWYKTGLIGLAGMFIALLAVFRTAWATMSSARSQNEEMIAVGLLSAVVAFVVFSMSEPVLYSRFGWIPAALVFGLRAVQERQATTTRVTVTRRSARAPSTADNWVGV